MELDKQNYMGSLKAKYEGITGYLEMVAAANKYYAGVETTIQFEAAQKAAQAWEGFKDHFSHVLARMVDEGKFSAKAIGDAFAGALKRIAIERVAQDTIDVLFDYLAPKGGSIRNFITSNKTPSGEASSFDKVLGALGTIATVASLFLGKGGMVYKPSLALVGEKGPERVLNPAETRAYNNSQDKILPYIGTALTRLATLVGETRPEQALNPVETHTYNADYQNDNSTVNIYIHTDADGLRSMDAYKFAQMYKEAKRSQLLAG